MKHQEQEPCCPINAALTLFGDSWSLLIMRDMLALGKKTFGDFLESKEHIGPSVLAQRLAHLEENGVISKEPDPQDGRKFIYRSTESGLALMPILYDFAAWSLDAGLDNACAASWGKLLNYDKMTVLKLWRQAVEAESSLFKGPQSVVCVLGLGD